MRFREEHPRLYRLVVGLAVVAVIIVAGNGLLWLYRDELIARGGETNFRPLQFLPSGIALAWFVVYFFKLRTD